MHAYGRGSKSLAGAASLKHRMPACVGDFAVTLVAQLQSTDQLNRRLRVRIPPLSLVDSQ